jgi:K+-transporting ATPase ATPase A chain
MGFFLTILTLVVALGLAWRYLGSYMAAVFDGRVHFLGFIERPIYRMLGTSPEPGSVTPARWSSSRRSRWRSPM